MSIFDNLGEKIQDAAKISGQLAQTAAKKSGNILEITKLKLKIQEEQNKIKNEYMKMGSAIYKKYSVLDDSEIPEEFKSFIDIINEMNRNIESMKSNIVAVKDSDIDLDENDFEQDYFYQADKKAKEEQDIFDVDENNSSDSENKDK